MFLVVYCSSFSIVMLLELNVSNNVSSTGDISRYNAARVVNCSLWHC